LDSTRNALTMERKMPIVQARIDDRLVHGQITVSWSKVANPDIIAVVDDKVASDDIRKSALEIGAPIGIELAIYPIRQAIKELDPKAPKNKKRVFLIAPNPKDFLDLIIGGVKIGSINVGQMGFRQGKKQISKTLSVDKKDIEAFKKLYSMGVALEHRQLPSDKKVELVKLLPEIK
jgi:mannose/fructose/sorbose-specific phosphotransferase system IIB component